MSDKSEIINLSKLDFEEIKASLREFLRTKPEMQDFDFEGSGWSYLLDLLAYNTAFNGFYLNMIASEMFLDSAQLRNDIVSKAKLLGYMPDSVHCARAKVRVNFKPAPGVLPQQIYIPKETVFTGTSTSGTRYEFVVVEPQTLYLINPSGAPSDYDGTVFSKEFEIIEGVRLTHRFTVTPDPEQRFIIPNANVDTSSIKVWVQNSATNAGLRPFIYNNDITEIDSESKVFYLQYTENGLCEVYFGDGIISAGFQVDSSGQVHANGLQPGNIVIIEYIVSKGGIDANGIKQFSAAQKIGVASPSESSILSEVVTTTFASYGAKDPESDKHIKYYAPINFEMQNRAVTELDFEQMVTKRYPQIDAIAVWGGEENAQPQYGRVFLSIKPSTGYVIDNEDKDYIVNTILKPRCVVTQEPIIVDPDYIYIVVNSEVKFDFRNSIKRKQDIQYAVYDTIINYSNNQLERFGRGFVYSDFVTQIDQSDPGVYSNMTKVSLKKIIYPTLGIKEAYTISFANELDILDIRNIYRKAIYSSKFYYTDNDTVCVFAEDSFGSNVLSLFQVNVDNTLTKIKEAGTIDAITGEVQVTELFVPYGWIGNMNHVEFYATPKKMDLYSNRNLILVIDGTDVRINVENKPL